MFEPMSAPNTKEEMQNKLQLRNPNGDSNGFAEAMERQIAAGQQNAQVLQYSNAHRLIIIFDIVRIFPLYQSVTEPMFEPMSAPNTKEEM